MEIVETWYFQIWVNFGGMAEKLFISKILLIQWINIRTLFILFCSVN